MPPDEVQRELDHLRRRLEEAEQTVQALIQGRIDAVRPEPEASPLLLREAQEALRHSEQLLGAIFRGTLDAILIADDEGVYVDANPAACELFGLEREELLGRHLHEFTEPGADVEALWAEFLRHGVQEGDFTLVRPDGVPRHIEFRARANILPGRHLSVLRDVTEARQAEAERREVERRLALVLQHAPIGIFSLDAAGAFTLTSGLRSWAGISSPEQLAGRSAFELYGELEVELHGGGRVSGEEMLRRALAGEPLSGVSELQGTWWETWLVPAADRESTATRVIGITVDVSERWRLEQQLRQSQKMEAVGRLAGGLAHDFNNVLQAIAGFAELIRDAASEGDRMSRHAGQILRGTHRAATLVRQLMVFSRKQATQQRPVCLRGVTTNLEPMLRRLIGEDVLLRVRYTAEPVPVLADPAQLEQALVNLVVNARDAMPEGGTLELEVTRTLEPAAPGGVGWAHLLVRDTGHGMNADTRARIFEPFFTTKPVGKGTGLGLAMAYGIVTQAGGRIEVESEPGVGTSFSITFSLHDQPPGELDPGADVEPPPAQGTERILVVEDEDMVRELAVEILTAHGYEVLEAADANQALALIEEEEEGPFDLVLTDVVMPHCSGVELVKRLRPLRPDLKVVYMSGYNTQDMAAVQQTQSAQFLHKPFSTRALLLAVREALGES